MTENMKKKNRNLNEDFNLINTSSIKNISKNI